VDRHGEVSLNRPGSENGAEVWNGFSRNLGEPVIDLLQIAEGAVAGTGPGLRGNLRCVGANMEKRSGNGGTKT